MILFIYNPLELSTVAHLGILQEGLCALSFDPRIPASLTHLATSKILVQYYEIYKCAAGQTKTGLSQLLQLRIPSVFTDIIH
jgi:hypothetical protein